MYQLFVYFSLLVASCHWFAETLI